MSWIVIEHCALYELAIRQIDAGLLFRSTVMQQDMFDNVSVARVDVTFHPVSNRVPLFKMSDELYVGPNVSIKRSIDNRWVMTLWGEETYFVTDNIDEYLKQFPFAIYRPGEVT